jgi:Uma2 family endonuclease
VPPFANGDVLDQPTFHALYEQTPKGFKAELIGGVVHVVSPVSANHGFRHQALSFWAGTYSLATPGVRSSIEATVILSSESEPQPDVTLLIQPEAGGQTRVNESGYLEGAPELAIEVSVSSVSIDLNAKKSDYERYGVQEYLVVVEQTQSVHWFARGKSGFRELRPGANGVLQSKVFPGLWLEPSTVFASTPKPMLAVLERGLASPEHAKFVEKLGKRLAKRPGVE